MQRHARATNFFRERFAVGVNSFQVRRTKGLFCRFGENDVSHFQVAHRTVVRG